MGRMETFTRLVVIIETGTTTSDAVAPETIRLRTVDITKSFVSNVHGFELFIVVMSLLVIRLVVFAIRTVAESGASVLIRTMAA